MEILISIASKIAEFSVASVGQWLCYSFHYDNNIKNLTDQVNSLGATMDGMQNRVKAAENNVENIAANVDLWLKKVDDIIGKAKEFLEAVKEKNNSSQGACLNLKLRHKHSKTAKKMFLEIDKLLNVNFDQVAQRPAAQDLVTSTYTDYMTFNSRMSIMEELMEALGDTDINLIGVWGMPGVGKSTLVNEVAKKVKEEKLFDEVAILTLKQNPSLEQIQTEISETLDLRLDKETLGERAKLLNARLTKDNNNTRVKRLVILDNIWEKLDLEKIGIPPKGCKVVVTSRDKDLLTSKMGTQKDFGLRILPREEAWSLFEKMSGNSLQDSNLRSKAMEVSAACEGLPLALVTVATALKNKLFPEWQDALQQLKSPNSEGVMYSAIELSYNYLGSEELQPFFLLCAQMGSRIYYQDLLKKCFGLRLFHGINTLEKSRNRIYTLLRSLKDYGLLLDAPDISKYVRMHDRVRDASLSIARKTQNMLMMRDEGPVEWPNEDDIKICTSICVTQMDINEFPENLNFPELKFLHVHPKNRDLFFKIPDTFFEGMRKLKVLDLTYMQLSSLPSSLMLLTNLKTLCLDQCMLGDITMIGEMKNLEILSLIQSEFQQLPREIGFLTHLRMLDLSDCTELKVIPPNVLSCLIQLEELYVGNSFTQWDVEGLNNERASLAELKHLSRLTTLEVHIPDANMLPKDLLFEKLQRYKIFVGDVWDWSDRHENSRALKLKLNTSFHLERGIKMLLNGIENLCLDELKGVKSIIDELDMTGFQQLKHLHVQNNVEIEYIINSRGMIISDVVFPVLEMLSLKNMINLEEICRGQIPSASFRNLSIMKVEHCEKLKFIFSSTIAKGLPQLQDLAIQECSIMGAIIIKEGGEIEDRDTILFPQLRHLILHQLPKLVSFLSTQKSVTNDAGEIIPECELDFHMPILQEQLVFPNLETLKLSSIHSEEILRHNQHRASSSFKLTESRFQNLRYLKVKGSGNLEYLLSSSTATFMLQLKSLFIEDCKVMEEILLLTEDLGEEEIIPKVLFPHLESLVLKDLPVLKRFCVGRNIIFRSLKGMVIEKCPKFESFIFNPVSSEEISHTAMQPLFNEEVAFPSLETLTIMHMENLKIIWHDQLAEDSFFELQTLVVQYCENLVNIFESNMLTRFQSLERLEVSYCGSLQEVFELQRHDVRESHVVTAIPLIRLILRCLPKMKQVWNKDPEGIFSFQNLQVICFWECESLQSLFPASLARCLMELEDFVIDDCGVEEIFSREEIPEAATRFVFPKVTRLVLHKLPKLKWFVRGVHISEWPLLKELVVSECDQIEIFASKFLNFQETVEESQLETSIQQPLFMVEEVAFPSLETLTIMHMENLKIIWHDQLAEDSFFELQTLVVQYCENLVNIFESNMLTRFQSLERLEVSYCGSLQEVFELQRHDVRESHVVTAIPLKRLILRCLPKMKQVWNKDPEGIFSFQNLQVICFWECESLQSLFPASLARCLMELEDFVIHDCGVEEIFSREEIPEAATRFVFPKVTRLVLHKLPKFKWFVRGVHISEWPLLKELVVSECDQIEIFASKFLNFQETVEESQLETSIQQPLFMVEEVAFPSLETLTIMHMENLKIIWHDQLAEDSFFELQTLVVQYCENLVNIFESNMLTRFQSLERLEVSYCGSLQEVFELQRHDVRESHVVTAIPLKRLILRCLPKMKQVWNKDPEGIFSFQNLQVICFWECESLQSLFPASLARCLMELEDFVIHDCGVEEIFSREEIPEAATRFVFPKVTRLVLHKLPKLKWFVRGVHISEWPLLKELVVSECDQIEIFASKFLNFQETVEESQLETSIQQPLFMVEEVAFPSLETLTIMHMENLKIIWHDQLAEHSFFKLQSLFVEYCENLVNIFESNMLTRFQSLERLEVSYCGSLQEVFELQRHDVRESHVVTTIPLKRLILRRLPKMKQVWNKDPEGIFSFQNLQEICVLECESLQSLFPASLASSIYFQNLANLEIWKCHGLINLVTSSTAKSLLQLKKMSVSECVRITEVVTGEGGEASEVITFTQLTHLKLDCLPNLSSFCSRSYSFEFPSLEEVIVRECPKMKTFSHGALGTPKLERVQAAQEEEFYWKANLNTTIHWLWESKYNTITQ
ncbi:hypothetical protein ACB092_03G068200 [Castanea dentata]